MNQFELIKRYLPDDPIMYVTVTDITNGVSTVVDEGGNTYTVHGDSVSLGNKAWVKGKTLVGTAPNSLATYAIII